MSLSTAAIASDLLAQGRSIAALSRLAFAVALAGAIAAKLTGHPALAIGLAASVLCGLVAFFYAIRVGLDALLFGRLANGTLDLAGMDAGLVQNGLIKGDKAGRDLASRVIGARGLLVRQAVAFVAQVVVAVGAVVLVP